MTDLKIIDLGIEAPPPKKRVLIVDDEPAIHSLIFDTLSDDYQLIDAHNGREGVAKAEYVKPDVILMDMMMPDLGGYEAVRLLSNNPETKTIPVIFVTARNFEPSTIESLRNEPNVFAFLGKPFRPKDLRDVIKKAIDTHHQQP